MGKEKIVAIALNTEHKTACVIYSLATFKQLTSNFDLYAKRYEASNWSGCDKLERILDSYGLIITGEQFLQEILISGKDYDHGHFDSWEASFDRIVKVTPKRPYSPKDLIAYINDIIKNEEGDDVFFLDSDSERSIRKTYLSKIKNILEAAKKLLEAKR